MHLLIDQHKTRAVFCGIALLAILQSLVLCWGSAGDVRQQLFAVMGCLACGVVSLWWILQAKHLDQTSTAWIVALALIVRLIAVFASPLLEDDHYRYLWDGFQTATGLDPYRLAPVVFAEQDQLPEFWRDIVFSINHPDVPTIYGPVLQGLFALAYWIAPGQVGAIQGLLLLIDMSVLLLLVQQKIAVRGLLIYAIHPLILKEAMASAHPDGLVGLFLLLALIAWRAQQAMWVGVSMGLAIATKVSALVVLPLLLVAPQMVAPQMFAPQLVASRLTAAKNFRQQIKVCFNGRWIVVLTGGCLTTLLCCYAPFISQGGSDLKALEIFSREWRFNPLGYRILQWVWGEAARASAAGLIFLGIFRLATVQIIQAGTEKNIIPAIDYALILLLIFSPVVNPWYGLWLIAPALLLGRPLLACGVSVVSLAYFNTTVLMDAQLMMRQHAEFLVSWPLTMIELAVLSGLCYYAGTRFLETSFLTTMPRNYARYTPPT